MQFCSKVFVGNCMQVTIIGEGEFGTFLKEVLSPHCTIVNNADIIILAVPLSAYDEVCSANANKHLINVCSVQVESNAICKKYSDRVTGIHPLFGPNSLTGNSIVTHTCSSSDEVVLLFAKISCIIEWHNSVRITDIMHDEMMSCTHLPLVELSKQIAAIIANAAWISEECLPASFLQLKLFSETFFKVSEGTRSSIISNSVNM